MRFNNDFFFRYNLYSINALPKIDENLVTVTFLRMTCIGCNTMVDNDSRGISNWYTIT